MFLKDFAVTFEKVSRLESTFDNRNDLLMKINIVGNNRSMFFIE